MRKFSAYELNQLIKYHLDPNSFLDSGAKPVEYITGFANWADLELIVNENVLIPRIETEELVELVWKQIQNDPGKEWKLADIGTGSGAIAVALGVMSRAAGVSCEITAIDVSPAALEVARRNIEKYELQESVKLVESHLLQAVGRKFDIIVANLPYIPSARVPNLQPSVRDFEPHLALDGGESGLLLINQLMEQAPSHLLPGGTVWLEVDDTHFNLTYPDFTAVVFMDSNKVKRFWEFSLN